MFALSVGISRLQHSAWTRAPASGSDSDQTRTRQNLMASAPGSDLVLQQQRRMEALVAMDTPWTHVGKCIERNSWVGYHSLCPTNGDTWELGMDGDHGTGQQWMHKDTLSQIDEDIAYKERDLKKALVSSRAWTWAGRCIERNSQVGRYAFCPLRGGSWILTIDGIWGENAPRSGVYRDTLKKIDEVIAQQERDLKEALSGTGGDGKKTN